MFFLYGVFWLLQQVLLVKEILILCVLYDNPGYQANIYCDFLHTTYV